MAFVVAVQPIHWGNTQKALYFDKNEIVSGDHPPAIYVREFLFENNPNFLWSEPYRLTGAEISLNGVSVSLRQMNSIHYTDEHDGWKLGDAFVKVDSLNNSYRSVFVERVDVLIPEPSTLILVVTLSLSLFMRKLRNDLFLSKTLVRS